jgi:hypothetical protein
MKTIQEEEVSPSANFSYDDCLEVLKVFFQMNIEKIFSQDIKANVIGDEKSFIFDKKSEKDEITQRLDFLISLLYSEENFFVFEENEEHSKMLEIICRDIIMGLAYPARGVCHSIQNNKLIFETTYSGGIKNTNYLLFSADLTKMYFMPTDAEVGEEFIRFGEKQISKYTVFAVHDDITHKLYYLGVEDTEEFNNYLSEILN